MSGNTPNIDLSEYPSLATEDDEPANGTNGAETKPDAKPLPAGEDFFEWRRGAF